MKTTTLITAIIALMTLMLACSAIAAAEDSYWQIIQNAVGPSTETCDAKDNDCNGLIDDAIANRITDVYGTGNTGECKVQIDMCVTGDWSTLQNAVGPATEICDGKDNDCDGQIDEDYVADTSCFKPGICSQQNTASSCSNGVETPCSTGTPSAELCDIAQLDENCNGAQNENCECIEGDSKICGPETETGECKFGTQICSILGAWSSCSGAIYPTTEICDGIDNDCDGIVDNGYDVGDTCAVGVGACEQTGVKICSGEQTTICSALPGTPTQETCNNLDDDCDGIVDMNTRSCADAHTGICAIGPETCDTGTWGGCPIPQDETCPDNGVDNNCDGSAANDCASCDADGDGYRNPDSNLALCAGYPSELDCNDADASIHPGASESCNGIDDNCDGIADEGFDVDADGFTTCGGDCNDNNALINPSAQEICNGVDDNCNLETDEGVMSTFYLDSDNDGYGDANQAVQACIAASGYVSNGNDCSDSNSAINPGAVEIACDGIDNDCSGTDFQGTDADHDGYKIEGGSCGTIDCNDNNAAVNPGATEVCDLYDNNCDGLVDSADSSMTLAACELQAGVCAGSQRAADQCVNGMWQQCAAANYGSSYGDETCPDNGIDNNCDGTATIDCTAACDKDSDSYKPADAPWYCLWPFYSTGDCNDLDASVNPGAADALCNGIDDNCNGLIDEGYISTPTTCGSGACASTGELICQNGAQKDTCISKNSMPEICNGVDDNCDGIIDDVTRSCAENYNGACGIGTELCSDGTWTGCPVPQPEICNGIDDNCDGQLDEDSKVQFVFNALQNWGKKGDVDRYGVAPYVYADALVGSPFSSGAFVPINTQYTTTNKNVAGLAVDSGNGYFDVWLWGKNDGIQKEAVDVTLYLDGISVKSVQNIAGAPYEKSRDGKAKFGNPGQDQVWVQSANTISFIATVSNQNDAFRVYYNKVTCANIDDDSDGIPDYLDICPASVTDQGVTIKKNRYADIDKNGVFETATGKNYKKLSIVGSDYTMQDTGGCTCRDILNKKPGKDTDQYNNGCTKQLIENWIDSKGISVLGWWGKDWRSWYWKDYDYGHNDNRHNN